MPAPYKAHGRILYQRFKRVVPRRAENTGGSNKASQTMKGWVGEALEKGKRTRLRVAEEKQGTAVQPGSSRERKQRLANRALQRSGWRGQENPGRGTQTEAKRRHRSREYLRQS